MAVSVNQDKIKELLLAKGDKIALGAGGAVGALLLAWGVLSAASAPSPSGTIKELADGASRVTSAVAGDGEDPDPLPGWTTKVAASTPIDPVQFAERGRVFEPVFKPNLLRDNPQVVSITRAQLDVVRLPYKAYDIDDRGDTKLVGVLKDKKADTKDLNTLRNAMNQVNQQIMGKAPPRTGNRPPSGPPPAPPGGGRGGMPGGPGGGGMAGGPGGGGMGGGGMPGMGDGGGAPGMMGGGGMGAPTARADATVEYVEPAEVAKGNLVVAQSVQPLRAVMVHGLVPLKEQRLEYQRALKIPPKGYDPKTGEPLLDNVPPPQFAGFDVQKRVTGPDGKTSDWVDYDHTEKFYTEVRARAFGFTQEQGYVGKFFRYEDQLVHPLPIVADGLYQYPRLSFKEVDDAIEKMKQAGIQPVTPSEWEKRLSGPSAGGNPFDPRTGLNSGDQGTFSGMGGMGEGTGLGGGGMRPGMPGGGFGGGAGGGMRPGMPGGGMGEGTGVGGSRGGGPPGSMRPGMGGGAGGTPDGGGLSGPGGMGMGLGAGGSNYAQPETDVLVMRFLDTEVLPGYTYQYRVRLKLKNPNYGLKTGVGRPADARMEVIEGRWAQLPESVTLPPETQLYSIDPPKFQEDFKTFYEDHGREFALKRLAEVDAVEAGRRAVVQIQRWQTEIKTGGQKREPIGTWVVADLAVAPGEYIGRRVMVELPLWSAGLMNYVLRELPGGDKVKDIRDPKNQPKGWPLNFRTPDVLVDFDGGRQVERVGDRNVIDDAAQELLILKPDGKLAVRNSADDIRDKTREERNKTWKEWHERVKTRSTTAATPGGSGPGGGPGGGGFGRP